MRRWTTLYRAAALLSAALAGPALALANVDLILVPAAQTVTSGDTVYVDLLAISDGVDDEPFVAIDAILSWDPDYLELLGVDDTNAGYGWYFSGFPSNPDLNQGLSGGVPFNDGDALYAALAQLGSPAVAPGAGGPALVVTTLEFRALSSTTLTTVSLLSTCCDPDYTNATRVLTDDPWPGTDITGDISSVADVTIEPASASLTLELIGGCQPDVGPNGTITVELWMRDLTQNATVFVAYLSYDTDHMVFIPDDSSYSDDPFPNHIVPIANAELTPGELDLDGHVDLGNPTGSDEDALLATLVFQVDPAWECTPTSVDFRPDEDSRLSYQGLPIPTTVFDSPDFWVDHTPPAFSGCPDDLLLDTELGVCGAVADWVPPTATDNCDGPVAPQGSETPGTFFPLGVTPVSYTATDDCGNVSMCTFDIIISDAEPPTIVDCPATWDVIADANCQLAVPDLTGQVAATDNCDDDLLVTQSPVPGVLVADGAIVTLTVADDVGNMDQCQVTLAADDITPPVIAPCPDDQTLPADANCQVTVPDLTGAVLANATDNCDDTLDVAQTPLAGELVAGGTVVTITVTDDATNFASCDVTLFADDVTPPTITACAPDQDVIADTNCEALVPDLTGAVTAADNCDTDLTISQDPLAGSVMTGDTEVTLTATDAAGNFATCTAQLTLVDDSDPVITVCPADRTLDVDANCEATVPDLTIEVVATDNCDDDLTITQSPLAGEMITEVAGVILTVTDDAGNFATCTTTLTPQDNTDPVINTCPADFELSADANCEAIVPDLTASVDAVDNCDTDLTITQDPAAGATIDASTSVVVTVTDAAGNFATCTVEATLVDDTAPTITTCPPARDLLVDTDCAAAVPDLTIEVVATDNCDGDLAITQTPEAGTVITGDTVVTVTVADDAGNIDTCAVALTLVDQTPPTITGCPASVTIGNTPGACSAVLDWTEPTANDNCGVDSLVATHDPGFAFPVGTTAVVYTATDTSGNIATCSFTVTVNDVEQPDIIVCPLGRTLPTDDDCEATIPDLLAELIVEDNCDTDLDITQTPPAGTIIVDETSVTILVIDDAGNDASCDVLITPVDETPPLIVDCPDPIVAYTLPGELTAVVTWTPPTATDNCDALVDPVSVRSDSLPLADPFMIGMTTVTYTATDAAGNISDPCVFTVTVIGVDDCNQNGIDDFDDIDPTDPDGDGLVSADCNGNSVPDECEFDFYMSCIAGPDVPVSGDCLINDLDNDGDVDLIDFAIYQSECATPHAP
jgi:hypothetical protein